MVRLLSHRPAERYDARPPPPARLTPVSLVETALALLGGLLAAWALLVVVLLLAGRREDEGRLREALRLLPDVVRLVRRLAADRTLPRGVRVRLVLLLAYLVSPLDLVPDVLPVVGYLDDVLVVVVVLRAVVRVAGDEALERHWPGTPDGLAVVRRAVRRSPEHR